MFDVSETPVLNTEAHGQLEQNPWSKRLDRTVVVEQAVNFWKKRSVFSDTIDNINNDAPGEMSTMHPEWTNLSVEHSRLPQEECVYE